MSPYKESCTGEMIGICANGVASAARAAADGAEVGTLKEQLIFVSA